MEVAENIPAPIRDQEEILGINHFTPAGRIYINANDSIKLCTEFGVLIVYLIFRPPRVLELFSINSSLLSTYIPTSIRDQGEKLDINHFTCARIAHIDIRESMDLCFLSTLIQVLISSV